MSKFIKKIYKKHTIVYRQNFVSSYSKKLQEFIHLHFSKKLLKKPLIVFFLTVAILVLLVSGFFIFIKTNQDFSANFADNTLRPLIGNQSTITLESFFFAIEDRVNQVQYNTTHQSMPPKVIYAQTHTIGGMGILEQNPKFSLEPIPPLITDSILAGEGVWTPAIGTQEAVMIKTTYRPDVKRPFAIVSLVKMNIDKIKLRVVAGTQQPGGKMKPGPGKIPQDIQKSNKLIAAFNGGFQQKDGYYGMIVNDFTYLPLKQNLATLVIHQNTPPALFRYAGQTLGNDAIAVRQNGPLLVENAQIVTSSDAWNMQTWGLTTTNSMYTWRSGIGITKEGNILYASGPSLVPESLAKALQAGGAINAMQLDINPIWVRFILFNNLGNGQYSSYALDPKMVNGGKQYLTSYQKDFFYVYKK